jgi:hypothetical protein
MGSLTDYAEDELLDHVFNAAYSPAATVYLALCTADPTDAATGASMNECANANGYARTAITFGAAAARVITQSGAVNFPTASGGSWGTVSHWAIVDSNTYGAGNVLAHGGFTPSKAVPDGSTPSVSSAEINVTISAGYISNYLAIKFLDLMFRNQAYAAPDTYVALTTATIADSDTGSSITEPGGGSYARKQVNVNGGASPTWDLSTGDPSEVDNTHEIAMATATASWGTIVATAICDAATVGNLLMYDNGTADLLVDNGDTAKFAIGTCSWQLS